MQLFFVFATVLVAASAQGSFGPSYILLNSYPEDLLLEESQPIIYEQDYEGITHPRFRRDLSMDPKTGDVTLDSKSADSRIFGTVGSTDTGLFGKGGYEQNVFNDDRGKLDAQAYGRRDLSPLGDSSSLGGALKWQNENAAASFDVSKQIHGPTSWTAAGGGHWPVGKNGDFGLEGTYSNTAGQRDYGGRAVYNLRW